MNRSILLLIVITFMSSSSSEVYAIHDDFSEGLTPLSALHDIDLSRIFRDSFELFQLLRNEKGIYRDSAKFYGEQDYPASVAVIGIGLISLCIADSMNWISNAEKLTKETLQSITGSNPQDFDPDRNKSGYFRHWIDMVEGKREWNSEYSSIDTAILVSGALFCKKYFNSPEIASYVDLLWSSIDWSQSIANPETGEIFREFHEDGTGIFGKTTKPYNEYMIVAWLAMNYELENDSKGPATELWNKYYANTDNLPKKYYGSIALLSDSDEAYVSDFTLQSSYYLCHYFTNSTEYLAYMDNARRADKRWWSQVVEEAEEFQWGLGAGSAKSYENNYHADAIDNNADFIYSPHIIAGFLPTYSNGKNDLISLLKEGTPIFDLPTGSSNKVLWRRSLKYPAWEAEEIQGIDYASMLFGLATLPENLGIEFFRIYNNFFPGSTAMPWIPLLLLDD